MVDAYPKQRWNIPTDNPADKAAAFDARVQRYLRAFQVALRRRPTDLQRDLMQAAAIAQSRYEEALRDPHCKPQDLEALERIARRAGNAMHASFKIKPEGDALSRYLAGAAV
jgi:hypothetical protein